MTDFKQFASNQEVRWCPGCGDFAVLKAVQKTLAALGEPNEKHVFISGIGCAGRMPYYLETYGFHTLHGRAPAIATGLAMTRPDLHIWIVTGDGDALSIGAHHLLHLCRRNVNVTVLLLNNRVYGLTKGQASPTSHPGQISKTTPDGAVVQPLEPLTVALAAGATFVARGLDVDTLHLQGLMEAAFHHRGTSLIEIYQNCHIFNDHTFGPLSSKITRSDHAVYLEAGQGALFSDEQALYVSNGVFHTHHAKEVEPYVHTPESISLEMAIQLARMTYPHFPVAFGILKGVK